MMQTLLTQTSSAPANGVDKAPLNGTVENNGIDGGTSTDNKGDFAALITKAQSCEQGAVQASQSGAQTAKSLATESEFSKDDTVNEQDDADKQVEELLASDFLLRLQDALKLDTSLVTPTLALPVAQSVIAVDGNLLPPEGEALELEEGDHATALAPNLLTRQLAGNATAELPLAATDKASLAISLSPSAAKAVESEERPSPVPSFEGGGDHATSDKLSAEKATVKGEAFAADDKSSKPLTGAERITQLAKVLPVESSANVANASESVAAKEGDDSKSDTAASNAVVSKGQAAQQSAALKAFSEGLKPLDVAPVSAESAESTDGNDAEGAAGKGEQRAVEGRQSGAFTTSVTQGVASAVQGEAASSIVPPTLSSAARSDSTAAPVMMAPEPVLAQAQSQGPQAAVTSISAGIKQIEVTGSDSVRKAVPLEEKPKAVDAEKSLLATASSSESSQSQNVQHGQNSQSQVAESRPSAAEGGLRREPQQLPHLKLASQEAPAELHQKVNVMLAEKLQQAEIQLDPVGLGKMKIQIQLDSSSQASVHFVVQHGQTREMLEQAMPRLREMLAGQGIQLGQTQVQQQSQQQQQGQPAFSGQSQQGQGGGQSQAGNGQSAGDVTPASLGMPMESANATGIDFYA